MDIESEDFQKIREICEKLISSDIRSVVIAYTETDYKNGYYVRYFGSAPEALGLAEMAAAFLKKDSLDANNEDEE